MRTTTAILSGAAATAIVFTALLVGQSNGRAEREAGWRRDLEFLVAEARRLHAGPTRPAHTAAFADAAARLAARAGELQDHQMAVEIQRLMAMLGDGHSLLYPMPSERMPFAMLPIDVHLFDEGLFVVDGTGDGSRLRGAQIVAIGQRPVEQLLASMTPYVSRDNEVGVKAFAALYLVTPAFLEAWGAATSPTRAELTMRLPDGRTDLVALDAGPARRVRRRLHAPEWATGPAPLYLRNADRPYWTEWIAGSGALYFQFNQVADAPGQPLAAFARTLGEALSSADARALVVDVRHNNGGNNQLLAPLVEVIGEFGARPGARVFVITSRSTFSAAQNFINRLERRVPSTIFAGEPSMSRPNFTGEDNPVRLPFSGLTVSISNRYWQDSDAADTRAFIAPHLAVPLPSRAWLANQDPVLEAVLGKL